MLSERHMQVVSHFDELVEDGHAARDALVKIFNKKIKRSKQKDAGSQHHPAAHIQLLTCCTILSS